MKNPEQTTVSLRARRIKLLTILILPQLFSSAQALPNHGEENLPAQNSVADTTSGHLYGTDRFSRQSPLTLDKFPSPFKNSAKNRWAVDYKFFPGVSGGASTTGGDPSVPVVSVGFQEGPVLETLLWGSGGAIAGSLAGPLGTVVGAAVGAIGGFIVGLVYAPKNAKARTASS